uniref:Uncharacterized protein n=1 Tax=Setaria digitata TaxID=48799 RepID=A0A915PCF0_9BILA
MNVLCILGSVSARCETVRVPMIKNTLLLRFGMVGLGLRYLGTLGTAGLAGRGLDN